MSSRKEDQFWTKYTLSRGERMDCWFHHEGCEGTVQRSKHSPRICGNESVWFLAMSNGRLVRIACVPCRNKEVAEEMRDAKRDKELARKDA